MIITPLTPTRFHIKPYSTKELADLNDVSVKVFNRLLKRHLKAVGPQDGFYWSVLQVTKIVNVLGIPYYVELT